jgi:uncharacterized protein (DUF2141 family)
MPGKTSSVRSWARTLAVAGAAGLALVGTAAACDRFVTVAGVKPGAGPVMLAVFADEATFQRKPVAVAKVDATAAEVKVPACDFPAAEFAIAVYQDLNGNGQLDSNLLGLPVEPWGASGTVPRYSAPTWATSRVSTGAPIRLQLRS